MGLDNDTHATEGSLTFTTAKGRTGTVPFHVNPEEPKGLATAYRDLLVPLGDNKAWDGTLKRLSLKFTDAEGRISIDRIALDSPPVKSWDFTDGAEGWTFNPDVSRPSPGLAVSDVVADADNTDGAFVNHADIAWDKSRMQTFRAAEGSLARLDLWAFRKGETTRSLFLRIVRLEKGGSRSAETLFTGSVAAKDMSTDGGMISVHPNLKDLDPTPGTGCRSSRRTRSPARPCTASATTTRASTPRAAPTLGRRQRQLARARPGRQAQPEVPHLRLRRRRLLPAARQRLRARTYRRRQAGRRRWRP
ncbi:hypothetical protein [Streptomyces anulatus]|uniref:hypothetical protein n=1 Tax=Streptomyces anulatus TaxID=1892 RepID=UPI00364383AB